MTPGALSWCPGTAEPTFSAGHRLEDNPGVRRHLVKKPSRTQSGRGSASGLAPVLRRKKKQQQLDRRPHEVPDPAGMGLSVPLASLPTFSLPPCLPGPSPTSPGQPGPLAAPQALTLGTSPWTPHPRCLWS